MPTFGTDMDWNHNQQKSRRIAIACEGYLAKMKKAMAIEVVSEIPKLDGMW